MLAKQILSAGITVAGGRFINVVFQFAFNAILVRLLFKQDVADFFLTFSFISFFSILIAAGGENIAIKKFSDLLHQDSKSSARELLSCFIIISCLYAIGLCIILLILYLSGATHNLVIEYKFLHLFVICIWSWSFALQSILTEIFRAFGKFSMTVLGSGVLVNSFNLLLLILLYVFAQSSSFNTLLYLIMINSIVSNLILLTIVFNNCVTFDKKHHRLSNENIVGLVKHIIHEGVPALTNKLGLYFTILADLWLVSIFFSKEILADYSVASKLAVSASIFLSIANGVIPTFIGRLKNASKTSREQLLRIVATTAFIPTLLFFILLFFGSEIILAFIFGEDYRSAAVFLTVLLLAQIVNVFLGSSAYLLIMEGKNNILMKISLSTGFLAIISALISVSAGGDSLAIAWAFSLSSMLRNLLTYIAALKLCAINTAIYINPLVFSRNIKQMLAEKPHG